ncbi:hypothetical protein BDV38DRAFT_244733 [Aspergillus pseudotamarii]|uniref:Uncharacterized protein n=1 Tax=Aspergillus pseudotamarii TaxID=132259 RepID=A0A5N6SXG3_ASPPS|nr:uncharacterized protein BDV38DRAFT_244733 [Aspergillus pseudotamarii]KAE8138481.1 hypothetical protein BDV38DRAFT_244733 [Aspergillus pseudotamarii]
MRVIDPQSAVLTNIEVLAYLTANPPRRPPNPPPNLRHWVPSPDLRDHNTVVKEVYIPATSSNQIQLYSSTHAHLQKSQEINLTNTHKTPVQQSSVPERELE